LELGTAEWLELSTVQRSKANNMRTFESGLD
jgi:hypothetical protein